MGNDILDPLATNSRLAPVRASNNFIVNIQVRLKPGLEQSS